MLRGAIVDKKLEDWTNRKWRPMMGWCYILICLFDFVIFPVLWSMAQAVYNGGQINMQWNPITLQGAGLFHMAMGAILGVAAWTRGQEKLLMNTTTSTVQYQQDTTIGYQGKLAPQQYFPER